MSRMNPSDRIDKASWTLMEGIKDAAVMNVTAADLKISAEDRQRLISIVSASVDEGYHRGHRTFSKVVESTLQDVEEHAAVPIDLHRRT